MPTPEEWAALAAEPEAPEPTDTSDRDARRRAFEEKLKASGQDYSVLPKTGHIQIGESEPNLSLMERYAADVLPVLTGGIPAATGVYGVGIGSDLGAGLGALGGPAAPITIPLGTLLGGAAGGLLGAGAGADAQQIVLDPSIEHGGLGGNRGLTPEDLQRALAEHHQESPFASAIETQLPQAFFMRPSLTPNLTGRAAGAGLGAGLEYVGAKYRGEKVDPYNLLGAVAAGALLDETWKYGRGGVGGGAGAAEPPPPFESFLSRQVEAGPPDTAAVEPDLAKRAIEPFDADAIIRDADKRAKETAKARKAASIVLADAGLTPSEFNPEPEPLPNLFDTGRYDDAAKRVQINFDASTDPRLSQFQPEHGYANKTQERAAKKAYQELTKNLSDTDKAAFDAETQRQRAEAIDRDRISKQLDIQLERMRQVKEFDAALEQKNAAEAAGPFAPGERPDMELPGGGMLLGDDARAKADWQRQQTRQAVAAYGRGLPAGPEPPALPAGRQPAGLLNEATMTPTPHDYGAPAGGERGFQPTAELGAAARRIGQGPAYIMSEAEPGARAATDVVRGSDSIRAIKNENAGQTLAGDIEASVGQGNIVGKASWMDLLGQIEYAPEGGADALLSGPDIRRIDFNSYRWKSPELARGMFRSLVHQEITSAADAMEAIEKAGLGVSRQEASQMARSLFPAETPAPGQPAGKSDDKPRLGAARTPAEAKLAGYMKQTIKERAKVGRDLTEARTAREAALQEIRGDSTMTARQKAAAMQQVPPAEAGVREPKNSYAPVRELLTPAERDQLYENIINSPRLKGSEAEIAARALDRVLDPNYTMPLDKVEIRAIGKAMPALADQMAAKFHAKEYAATRAQQLAGIPRELRAGPDQSLIGRQGLFLAGTKPWFVGIKDYFTGGWSEAKARALSDQMVNDPMYDVARKAGLGVDELGERGASFRSFEDLVARPEGMHSGLVERVPGFGRPYRASARGGQSFMNRLRFDTFKNYYKAMQDNGVVLSDKQLKATANAINVLSGKGPVPASLQAIGDNVMFSTSLLSSRLMAPFLPLLPNTPRYVRLMAAKRFYGVSAAALGVVALAKLNGFKTSTNPTDSDGFKIRDGNTRVDLFGGESQVYREVATQINGYHKDEHGVYKYLGESGVKRTRLEELAHFGRSKLSPYAAAIADLFIGKTYAGDPVTWKTVAEELAAPMFAMDVAEVIREHGAQLRSAFYSGLSWTGFGIGTYERGGPQTTLEDKGYQVGWKAIEPDARKLVADGAITADQAKAIQWRVEHGETFARIHKLDAQDRKATINDMPPDQQRIYAPFIELDAVKAEIDKLENKMYGAGGKMSDLSDTDRKRLVNLSQRRKYLSVALVNPRRFPNPNGR